MFKRLKFKNVKVTVSIFVSYLFLQILLLAIPLMTTNLSEESLLVRGMAFISTFLISSGIVWFFVKKEIGFGDVFAISLSSISAFMVVAEMVEKGIEIWNMILMALIIMVVLLLSTIIYDKENEDGKI